MKKYIALEIVAGIAVMAGLAGMALYNAYTTIDLARQEPHFTISMIVVVVGFLGMMVACFFEKRAERKLARDRRRQDRDRRRQEQFDRETFFIPYIQK